MNPFTSAKYDEESTKRIKAEQKKNKEMQMDAEHVCVVCFRHFDEKFWFCPYCGSKRATD